MKRLIFMLFMILLICMSAGCGSIYSVSESASPANETGGIDNAQQQKELYIMVGMHIILPYWQEHRLGFAAAADELGVESKFTGENGNNALRQLDIFEQAVKTKPAGILVSPIDKDSMKEPINAAMQQGIPVICIDTDSPESNRLTYIGTDNYKSGYMAAGIIGEKLKGKGDVGILTIPGIYSLDQRKKGFEDCIKEKYPGLKVVSVMNDEADPSKAANVAGQMFKDYPAIAGLFGTDAASGVGAAIALGENNKLGQVKVVAFDKDSAVLDLVKQGKIEATLVQRTFTMSYYGLKFLYDYNHNRVKVSSGDIKINPLPSTVDTGVIVVTKDNVDNFR